MRSGFVSLIGRPNVGKSSLVNAILDKKIAIVSNKPQTTRNNIKGIYNDEDVQIVFIDTPGVHKPNHKLGKLLNNSSYAGIDDADVVLFLIDVSEELGTGDKFILEKLKNSKKNVFLVLNKIDKISKEELILKIEEYKNIFDFKEIIPVSASKKKNIDTLLKVIKEYLPDQVKYYETEETDKKIDFIIAEIIREKVFLLTSDEIPHSLTCIVNFIEYGNNSNNIGADIIVDRDALKKIVIGQNGSMIKEIGIRSRKEIEEIFNKKIYLDLKVKTIKKWRDSDKYLKEFGFDEVS